MRRRNILHLIDTGGPGGAETIFLHLVEELDRDRWNSIAVVPERDWLFETLAARGLEPRLVPTHGSFDLRYLRRLSAMVLRKRIDLIHAHLLTTSVYGSVVGRLHGVPTVCTFHGEADISPGESYRAAKFRIIDRPRNRVVFVSESLRRTFLRWGGLERVGSRVIYNGIDTKLFAPRADRSFREELGVGTEEILVGAVGNVRSSKDYPNFLRAAALLRSRSHRYRFVIVGDARGGPLVDELLSLRREMDLEGCVHLAGFREDVPRIMNGLDVYALSSSAEGFSLTTVQAMACGVPVIATRCGGPEEIIDDRATGVLVEPRSPEALAAAIEALAQDPTRMRALARAGRERAEERFALDVMVSEYASLYEECLGRGALPVRSPAEQSAPA